MFFQPCVDANDIVKGNKGRRIYVNITVLDASKAIKHKVTKKVQNTRLPNSIKQVVAKQASHVAGNRPSGANKVAEKLSQKLVAMIQLKMKEKGITITCKVVFLEGPYFVLQLQVIHCDAVVLAEARDDQSFVGGGGVRGGGANGNGNNNSHSWGIVRWGMDVMGTGPSTKLESDILPTIVHNKLKSSLDEILQEKLTEQKVETKVATLNENKQARYFFDQLEKIHDKEYHPQNEVHRIRSSSTSNTPYYSVSHPQQGYYPSQDQESHQHQPHQHHVDHHHSPSKGKKVQPSLLSSTTTLRSSPTKSSSTTSKAEKHPPSSGSSKLERFKPNNLTSKHHHRSSSSSHTKDDECRDDIDTTGSKITTATSKMTTATTKKMTALTATTSQIIRKVVRKHHKSQDHHQNDHNNKNNSSSFRVRKE